MLSIREILKLRGIYIEGAHTALHVAHYLLSDNFLKSNIPQGHGQPIVFFPGYTVGDFSLAKARDVFEQQGYTVYPWEQGTNLFFNQNKAENLEQLLEQIVQEHGQPAYIVGQSMGGVIARELTRKRPELVAGYATLGSPFGSIPVGGQASKLTKDVFKSFHPDLKDLKPEQMHDIMISSPNPYGLHVYSKKDRVVDWHTAREPNSNNLEVSSSHTGMAFDPNVLVAVGQHFHVVAQHMGLNKDHVLGDSASVCASRTRTPNGDQSAHACTC